VLYGGRLRDLGLLHLAKRILAGVLPMCMNTWWRDEDDGARLFPGVSRSRTRGNRHKVKCRRFCLKIRKTPCLLWL